MCRSCLSSEGAILPRRRGHFASCTVHVLQMWTNTFHQDQPGMLHIAMWIPCESPVKLGLEGWVEVLSPLRIWLTVCELEAMAENSWFTMILFIEDGDFPVRKLWVYQRLYDCYMTSRPRSHGGKPAHQVTPPLSSPKQRGRASSGLQIDSLGGEAEWCGMKNGDFP
jgi:hypothetical protein